MLEAVRCTGPISHVEDEFGNLRNSCPNSSSTWLIGPVHRTASNIVKRERQAPLRASGRTSIAHSLNPPLRRAIRAVCNKRAQWYTGSGRPGGRPKATLTTVPPATEGGGLQVLRPPLKRTACVALKDHTDGDPQAFAASGRRNRARSDG